MKPSISACMTAVGFGMVLIMGVGSGNAADDLDVSADLTLQLRCDQSFVAGVYGFNFDTLGEPAQAGIGVLQLRENGALRLKMEGFVEASTTPFLHSLWGTWEVRPDCTGSMSTTDGAAWTFVAVENANELLLISDLLLEEADAKRLVRR